MECYTHHGNAEVTYNESPYQSEPDISWLKSRVTLMYDFAMIETNLNIVINKKTTTNKLWKIKVFIEMYT